jgi:hypothetical protein
MLKLATIAAVCLIAATATVEARGKCDGFQRCRCGVTAARNLGLPLNYKGHNLKRAAEWKAAFPRTSARAGAVLYQHGGGPSGHVAIVQQITGACTATVKDERGSYERNICIRGAVFLDPHGNIATSLN